MLIGELSSLRQAAFPLVAAIGGSIVPALFYVFVAHQGETLKGWAIPMATDIAFVLGVLAILGSRIPVSLKIFLTALAIADDLIAVLVVAIFYTEKNTGDQSRPGPPRDCALLRNKPVGRPQADYIRRHRDFVWYAVLKSGVRMLRSPACCWRLRFLL